MFLQCNFLCVEGEECLSRHLSCRCCTQSSRTGTGDELLKCAVAAVKPRRLRLKACENRNLVHDARENPVLRARSNPSLKHKQIWMDFLVTRTHHRRTCQEKHSFGRTTSRNQHSRCGQEDRSLSRCTFSLSSTKFRRQFDEAWENFLMAQLKEPEDDLLEGLSPSTVREIDSHAECLSTSSFRSGSLQSGGAARS